MADSTKYLVTRGAVHVWPEGETFTGADLPEGADVQRLLDLGVVVKHGSKEHRRYAEERGLAFDDLPLYDQIRTDSPPTLPAEGVATVEETAILTAGQEPVKGGDKPRRVG